MMENEGLKTREREVRERIELENEDSREDIAR